MSDGKLVLTVEADHDITCGMLRVATFCADLKKEYGLANCDLLKDPTPQELFRRVREMLDELESAWKATP